MTNVLSHLLPRRIAEDGELLVGLEGWLVGEGVGVGGALGVAGDAVVAVLTLLGGHQVPAGGGGLGKGISLHECRRLFF